MKSISFWQKTYIVTLLIFLLALNGGVLVSSVISRNQSVNSDINQRLTQHQVLLQRLMQDIYAVQTSRAFALPQMYKQGLETFHKNGFLLEIRLNKEVLASNLPQYTDTRAELDTPVGSRSYLVRTVGKEPLLYITSSLTKPFEGYMFTTAVSMEKLQNSWRNTTVVFTVSVSVVSVLLAIGLYFALRRISRPLIALAHTAEAFTAGNHEARAVVQGNDEIGQLANSFNRMANQTVQDMQSLALAADEKQRLVDALSHEMRTPLTAIQGYAEYIQRASLSEEEMYEATNYITEESHRLQQIANQLLKLAVLRNEPLIMQNVEIEQIMRHAFRTVMPKASTRGIKLKCEKPPVAVMQGDEALLESLLVNLMDNAVKACKEGDSVTLAAAIREEHVIFAVEDTGRGMSEEVLKRIGEPFFREDKARSRAEGGAGLGLSLCFSIVKCHGGHLRFKSTEGKGTVAFATFNLAQ
ncbi:MAG: HAMP domain-containing sensor histidine kinase [Oscillospiraceae bacterium]